MYPGCAARRLTIVAAGEGALEVFAASPQNCYLTPLQLNQGVRWSPAYRRLAVRRRARWIFAGPYLALCATVVLGYVIHVRIAGGEVIDLYGPLLWLFALPWSAVGVAVADSGAEGLGIILLLLAPLPNAGLLYAAGRWLERRQQRSQAT